MKVDAKHPDPVALAEQAVRDAEAKLSRDRLRLQEMNRARGDKRAAVAAAVTNWQAAFPIITRDTLVRQDIARQQQYRQDVKDGKIAPHPPSPRGPSAIDQFNGLGGAVDRRGGPAFRRGAFDQSRRHERAPLPPNAKR